jgi:hypothetical protein
LDKKIVHNLFLDIKLQIGHGGKSTLYKIRFYTAISDSVCCCCLLLLRIVSVDVDVDVDVDVCINIVSVASIVRMYVCRYVCAFYSSSSFQRISATIGASDVPKNL